MSRHHRSSARRIVAGAACVLATLVPVLGSDGAAARSVAGCSLASLPRAARAGQITLWGHARSLARGRGGSYVLRFDPAMWLSGVTANRASSQDGGESPVPNDVYVVDESARQYVYVVPGSARATVLTAGPCSTAVSVAELAQIVAGANPRHRSLFDQARALGFWITVGGGDHVRSIDQQYQP